MKTSMLKRTSFKTFKDVYTSRHTNIIPATQNESKLDLKTMNGLYRVSSKIIYFLSVSYQQSLAQTKTAFAQWMQDNNNNNE